jgi:hypothetical protein
VENKAKNTHLKIEAQTVKQPLFFFISDSPFGFPVYYNLQHSTLVHKFSANVLWIFYPYYFFFLRIKEKKEVFD